MTINLKIEKKDCWIGLRWTKDWAGRLYLYICLLPTIVIHLKFGHWWCEEKGCWQETNHYCHLKNHVTGQEMELSYCVDHAKQHGFCFRCGRFWSGVGSFDFGPGVCINCRPEYEADFETE